VTFARLLALGLAAATLGALIGMAISAAGSC